MILCTDELVGMKDADGQSDDGVEAQAGSHLKFAVAPTNREQLA